MVTSDQQDHNNWKYKITLGNMIYYSVHIMGHNRIYSRSIGTYDID